MNDGRLIIRILHLTLVGLFHLGIATYSSTWAANEVGSYQSKQNVIILIHGFTGGKNTWGQLIPLLREDKDLKGRYEVHELRFPTTWSGINKPTIEKVAENLKLQLEVRFKDYHNIYLIAHSMGGLVVQSMIVQELKAGNASKLDRIQRIIFFGTPLLGVDVPKFMQWFNKQVRQLDTKDGIVQQLLVDWIHYAHDPEIDQGSTNYQRKFKDKVTVIYGLEDTLIPEISAKGVFRNSFSVPGDHTSMKMPNSRDDDAYIAVKTAIYPPVNLVANDDACSRGLSITPLDFENRLRALPGYPVKKKQDKMIYTHGFRASFSISHSGIIRHPIKLIGLRLIVEEYQGAKDPVLAYKGNLDNIHGKGTAEVQSFQVELHGTDPIKSRWITKELRSQPSKSENFFDIEPPRVLTFSPNGDPGEEIDVAVTATQAGFYKTRFKFQCSTGGSDSEIYSEPIYIYLQ